MFFYLILLFTVLPALELMVLIEVGTVIGTPNTILLIILTGIVGAALARYQGFAVLRNIQLNLNQGIMPTEEMLDGVMILVGGVVLLTPGFITDTIGFLLLIPLTRALLKLWVKHTIKQMIDRGAIVTIQGQQKNRRDIDIEDADFHE